ncbi:hypothetical protein BDZ45DRAFT_50717 [Acephala macrosclerotiorum]|nr:hypothetical protein BDZ45DRAFT_50717 [Acephala macrosclerotiorum]
MPVQTLESRVLSEPKESHKFRYKRLVECSKDLICCFALRYSNSIPMANNLSQQRFSGWNLPEERATEEDSIAPACNTDSQQEIQPHVARENLNLSDTFSAQDVQSQAMWASFETVAEPVFFEAGNYSAPNPDSSYFSATSTLPSVPTNNCPGTEVIVVDSEIGSNSVAPHAPLSGMHHDCSNHDLLLSSGNCESYEHMMGGQLGVEQLQLIHRPTASFGVEDLQQVPDFQYGFSQLLRQPRFHQLLTQQTDFRSLLGHLAWPHCHQLVRGEERAHFQ